MPQKLRIALIGSGHRGIGFFAKGIIRDHAERAELVALLDSNIARARIAASMLNRPIPVFSDFEKMLAEARPDTLIVCSKDQTHERYIVGGLERGLDIITEKPMAIDATQIRNILEAEKKSGKKIRVAFNYRYAPFATRVKQLLSEGVIGKIHLVHFQWVLDTRHGADYFRRWHRRKENSGGLMVHKATHHFDIMNWYLDDDPAEVYATGTRNFYGPTRDARGERCLTCPHAKTCEFFYDLKANKEAELYLGAEGDDGYFRDRCVFDPEIDIEDTVAVAVTYTHGARMSYSLVAYAPQEGNRMFFYGSRGRLEAGYVEGSNKERSLIRIWPLFQKEPYIVEVPRPKGEHGGADPILLDALLNPDKPDPLKHQAGARAGACSVLTGVAANESIRTGRPVRLDSLVPAGLLGPRPA